MEKFDKFEKLDRQIEQTIHEVETMNRHALFEKFIHNSFAFAVIWALFLNLIIETLGRYPTTSIWGGVQFMAGHPMVFCYNALLIFSTLLVASVFRRRTFVFTIISIFWMAIGITNGVILTQRMTPFTVKDLSNLEDGATIVTSYLSKTEIILIGAGILLALAGLVLLFVKGPKKKGILKWKRNLIVVILMTAMCFGATSFMVKIGKVETFFGNLAYAYRDYGVVYCFINTWLNTGISKPSGYNEKTIKKIFNEDELGEDGVMLLEDKDVDVIYRNSRGEFFLQKDLAVNSEAGKADKVETFKK